MDKRVFTRELIEVVALYSAGVSDGSYERLMDDLTGSTSDAQWECIGKTIDEVDAVLAETDQGTPYQRAKAAGKPAPFVFPRRVSQAEVAAVMPEPDLPVDPTVLEWNLSAALTQYLEAVTEWKRLKDNQPLSPAQPYQMTAGEYIAWKQECVAADERIGDWGVAEDAAKTTMTRLHNALGDLMPDAVKLVIPALGDCYTVWFTGSWSDTMNKGSKYRSAIEKIEPQ